MGAGVKVLAGIGLCGLALAAYAVREGRLPALPFARAPGPAADAAFRYPTTAEGWTDWTEGGVVVGQVRTIDAGMRLGAGGAPEDVLAEGLEAGAAREFFIQDALGPMEHDRAGDGLDAGDIAAARRDERLERGGGIQREMRRYDLDGDGRVTLAEMAEVGPGGERMARRRMAVYDRDEDEVATAEEMQAAVPTREADRAERLMALDPNGDGRLTRPELTKAAARVFDRYDRNRDTTISEAEAEDAGLKAIRDRRSSSGDYAPVCRAPAPPAGADILLYGSGRGEAVSTVATGGQDEMTTVTTVRIEKGREPLYLVLASGDAVLWNLVGDTGRVAGVAVSSSNTDGPYSASGVTGLPAAKVAVLRTDCIPSFELPQQSERAQASVARVFGRGPVLVAGAESASDVALPSGRVTQHERTDGEAPPTPQGFDRQTWVDAVGDWPMGVFRADPAAVVAHGRAEPYAVLPGKMGLAQLTGQGVLERRRHFWRYRLVKPLARWPAGLISWQAANFVIAAGVPEPAGDPGAGCVAAEAGWTLLHGDNQCRMVLERGPPQIEPEPQPRAKTPPANPGSKFEQVRRSVTG